MSDLLKDFEWFGIAIVAGVAAAALLVGFVVGFFELLQVSTDDGRTGTLARKNNGKQEWWVRPLDEKEVPE